MDQTVPAEFVVAPEQPEIAIALYGGVFAKRHVFSATGSYVGQHAHAYDHLSIIAFGGVRVWRDAKLVGDFTAPAEIRIPAGSLHTFMTLAEGTVVYCVHNIDWFEETEQNQLPGLPHG